MLTVKIVDSFNNFILSSGPLSAVPRIGDKVDMRKYTPAPTVREVLWRYEHNGDVVVTVCVS